MPLVVLFACTAATEDTPYIAILAPEEGDVVCGAPLVVATEVRGIVLVDPYPDEEVEEEPGTGHIDVTLNGQDPGGEDGMSGSETITIAQVADGEYQLKVELSSADHTAIEPYAGDFIYVTVDATVCAT